MKSTSHMIAPKPTHGMIKTPGTGKAIWDGELERWVVYRGVRNIRFDARL